MRKVAIVTGSRAEYSIYGSVLDAIDQRKDLEYELIVTGMHISKGFGHSIDEIKRDGRKVGAKVTMLEYGDTLGGMVKNTGKALIGIAEALEKMKPDVILVVGDRGEQLAAAMAGAHMNIPVAHLHGGEVSGTIDESIRHAITKFAHIHFPATKLSRDRIIKLGEKEENVYLVGAPGIDSVKKKGKMTRQEIAAYFKFDPKKKIILAIQHPVTTEFDCNERNMKIIADTLIELDEQTVCIYSNSDAGYLKMMELLESRIRDKKKEHKIKVYKTLSHEIFLSLMKQADVMIGNSSSGIIEAPSCETPYVLVGTRQRGREKADSILEVDYKKEEILKAVKKVFTDVKFKKIVKTCEKPYDPFDDADAGKRIAKILATFKITPELFEKKIAYHRFSEKTSKLLFSRDRSDKLDGKTKVLVISPHPDDEVLGCGGTILRHRKDGDEIFLCIVTKGYAPDWSEEFLKNRPKEIERASKILGIKKTYFLNYPTVKLDTIPQKELNEAIAKIIHELEPNILYIPHKGDLNKDHRLVFEASLVATRPGSYKPEKILSYEILSETEWGQIIEPFVPNVYVDISSTFEEKIESMKAYASELRQYPHLRSLEIIEALAKKRGAEMGMRLAEAFISIREVG